MAERMIIDKDERQHMSLSNSASFSGRDLAISVLLFLLGLGAVGFNLAAVYLGCAGAWSALWPGCTNCISWFVVCMEMKYTELHQPSEDVEESKKNKLTKITVAIILSLAVVALFLTLGLLNVINLTFALFIVINYVISSVLYVLNIYCGDKVKNLCPRFMYASGLVATVTFAFLIAFKVVSLATVAPLVAPSLAFAFLCFVYCVIQRCKSGGFCGGPPIESTTKTVLSSEDDIRIYQKEIKINSKPKSDDENIKIYKIF